MLFNRYRVFNSYFCFISSENQPLEERAHPEPKLVIERAHPEPNLSLIAEKPTPVIKLVNIDINNEEKKVEKPLSVPNKAVVNALEKK